MPPSSKPEPITHGTRVLAPVPGGGTATGRVNFLWPHGRPPTARVQFPPGSPFLDDWTLYHLTELTPAPPEKEVKTPAFKENYPSTETAT
jgi:hypothetical protein